MSEQKDEREPYEKPAIVYEDEMEALAASCVDCDINQTKNSAASFCPLGPGTNLCMAPFSS